MTERAFEMLWDCTACGTRGLLGKSQRRCPNCGAPQDESKRYFPQPGQEVEAVGHRFEGADWRCAACTTPNGNAASFCCNCGNPKDGNAAVKMQADRVVKDGAVIADPNAPAAPKAPASSSKPLPLAAALVALAVLGTCGVLFCGKKGVEVDVVAHTWTREIDVERFAQVRDDAWCDQRPADAYSITTTREQRSTKKVQDGEECHERNVDNGDGTFVKKNECKPKFREEPVYDDKCHFVVDRWKVARTEKATGQGTAGEPRWPDVRVSGGSGVGAERAGARRETYDLQLRNAKDAAKVYTCAYDVAAWKGYVDGTRLPMQVRLVGSPVCDSLGQAP